MGRLFWKFFLFTLLAQVIAILGVGGAVWLKDAGSRERAEQLDLSPPAAFMIESAASTLQYGGVSALRNLLDKADRRHQIVAVDDAGRELLGRSVNPQTLAEARAMLQSDQHRREVRQLAAPDGAHYLLFVPAHGDAEFGGPGVAPPPEGPPPDDHPPSLAARGAMDAMGGPGGGSQHELQRDSQHGPQHGPGGHPQPFQPFIGIATAVLASLIFAWLLAWYFSKPIHSLRSAFEKVAGGDLDTRLGSQMGLRRDELADLGRDFDGMAERLRKLVEGQRRLLHDVSHELRSPLARLHAAIGLARQQPEKTEASLARIERESARMEKLVDELLTLSRLEAAAPQPDQEDIDFGELLANVVADATFEAEASSRTLEFVGNGAASVSGDPNLLHRAIENVVRNALKHSAAGSAVVVEAKTDAARKEVRVSVLDRGPGVAQEDLQAIFEPFFRGAGGVQNSDGHGLGLAIAQRVVRSHGGRIVAANREGGGLCVEITLPAEIGRAIA